MIVVRRISYLLMLVTMLLSSCKPREEKSYENLYDTLPAEFADVLRAHGGLEKWRNFGKLEYDLQHEEDATPTEHYILDLVNRHDLTVADSFNIGFDGNEVWVSPNKNAFKGRSARFYHNLYSYFLTIPFIAADPGTIYSVDTLTLNGKLFDVVGVSYKEGVGDADKDAYKLLIDPHTHKMEKLLYTVTYYSGEAHENFNALSYENWQEVNGIILPTKLVGYKYTDGILGDKRYEVTFHNIGLDSKRPDPKIFIIPPQAEVDSLKVD